MKRVFLVMVDLLAGSLFAGEVVINHVSNKEEPFKRLDPSLSAKRLVEMYGEKQGKEMSAYYAKMIKKNPQHYSVNVTNTDKVRKAVGLEVLLQFYGQKGKKLGEKIASFDCNLEPGESEGLTFDCDTYAAAGCRESDRLEATIKGVKWFEVKYGADNEVVFEWNGTRWFLENQWDQDKALTLRSFSGKHYTDKDFDGKIFPGGKVEPDKTRYYRVLKEPIPARFPDDPVLHEIEQYWHEIFPGFIVENGQRKKPRMLDLSIGNTDLDGTIAAGEYVQMKNAFSDKKTVEVAIAPVCQTGPRHRGLISKIRFVMGEGRVKDAEAVDQAIRAWLEPVSIGEVAKTCGPNSGNLVRRWDPSTTIEDIENALGPSEARSEVKGGEVLAYGAVRLRFVDGKLADLERKTVR